MRGAPDRVGGRLCLDFVNTVDPRAAPDHHEYLADYGQMLDWVIACDVALPCSVSGLRRLAKLDPAAAQRAHTHILAMRESLYAVLLSSIRGEAVHVSDLREVNQALGDSIGHRRLLPADRGGVREGWRRSDSLEQVLWPIAIDAWDLLTEPELARVRQCPVESGGCGWLFLDTSRSNNRRWCDMRTCGNRAKARAHYSRAGA